MATDSIKTVWREDTVFDTEIDGHTVTIDVPGEGGKETLGPGPKKLQLVAAAGCTGLDIVAIAKKMRIDLKGFDVRIDAEVAEEHPKQYTSLKVVYEFEGDNLPKDKLERACELSFEKYCGVLAMYKKSIPVTYKIVIK